MMTQAGRFITQYLYVLIRIYIFLIDFGKPGMESEKSTKSLLSFKMYEKNMMSSGANFVCQFAYTKKKGYGWAK